MSMLLGSITPGAAFLASDTVTHRLGDDIADAAMEMSKHLVFPHLRTMLGGTGHTAIYSQLCMLLQNRSIPNSDFDGLVDVLPDLANREWHELRSLMAKVGREDSQVTLVAIGWSDKSGRPEGIVLRNFDGQTTEMLSEFRAEAIGPGIFTWPPPLAEGVAVIQQAVNRKQPMKVLLRSAAIEVRKSMPDDQRGFFGGRLIMTTLGRHRIDTEEIYAWPDHLAARAQR